MGIKYVRDNIFLTPLFFRMNYYFMCGPQHREQVGREEVDFEYSLSNKVNGKCFYNVILFLCSDVDYIIRPESSFCWCGLNSKV